MPSQLSTWVPGGTAHDHRVAVRAVSLGALAVPAPLGAEVHAAPERLEVAQRVVDSGASTSPPRPPSPPSGPPLGTCASRLNDRQPLPPAPARTSKWARSVSMVR